MENNIRNKIRSNKTKIISGVTVGVFLILGIVGLVFGLINLNEKNIMEHKLASQNSNFSTLNNKFENEKVVFDTNNKKQAEKIKVLLANIDDSNKNIEDLETNNNELKIKGNKNASDFVELNKGFHKLNKINEEFDKLITRNSKMREKNDKKNQIIADEKSKRKILNASIKEKDKQIEKLKSDKEIKIPFKDLKFLHSLLPPYDDFKQYGFMMPNGKALLITLDKNEELKEVKEYLLSEKNSKEWVNTLMDISKYKLVK